MGAEYIGWETTREQEERKARENLEQARLVGVVETLAKSKDGVHFLHSFMEATKFLHDIPVTNETLMAFYEGQRLVGRWLFSLIQKAHCIEAVCQEDING